MWFKLPPTTLQAKYTGVITSLGTTLLIQSKETAPSLTAVNMEQEAQKAHIYHFTLPKALPKATGNMAITKRSSCLLEAVEGRLFISLWKPRTTQAFQPTTVFQCTIVKRQEHRLPPTWKDGT